MNALDQVHNAVFVERWPFWAGGLAIASVFVVLLVHGRRVLGVSTGFEEMCAMPSKKEARRSWRMPFFVGIVGGGLIAALLAGGFSPTVDMGMFDRVISASLPVKAAIFAFGGILIGFGTRLGGGCTSGHGIAGMSQLAPSSLIATGAFMGSGFLVTNLVLRAFGG